MKDGVMDVAAVPSRRGAKAGISTCGNCGQEMHATDAVSRIRVQRDELALCLRQLLDRIELNGGIGPYKGGQPFIIKHSESALAKVTT